ncbi:hypothetical protein BDW62DRAFT_194505 [Aspergillus aurantiobrunneus]
MKRKTVAGFRSSFSEIASPSTTGGCKFSGRRMGMARSALVLSRVSGRTLTLSRLSLASLPWIASFPPRDSCTPRSSADVEPTATYSIFTCWSVGYLTLFSIWRPINGPVKDRPLAVCDGRSVNPSKLLEADIIRENYTGHMM